MDEVTGGKIPAPTWKRIMEFAEVGLAPASVAGIPLDDSYTAVAAVQQPTPEQAPATDEVPDSSEVMAEGDAKDILDGMIALFQKKPTVSAQGKKRSKSRRKVASSGGGGALVLPRANASRKAKGGFIESLFSPRKKKRRKPLFSF